MFEHCKDAWSNCKGKCYILKNNFMHTYTTHTRTYPVDEALLCTDILLVRSSLSNTS